MNNLAATLIQTLAGESGLLWSLAWKSIAILALIIAAMLLGRRSTAAARHLAWTVGFICLLCLPVVVRYAPVWHAPAWIVRPGLNLNAPEVRNFTLEKLDRPAASSPSLEHNKASGMRDKAASSNAVGPNKNSAVAWSGIAVGVWLAGIFVGLANFLSIQIRLKQMTRRARANRDSKWFELLKQLRSVYRIRRPVNILIADGPVTPMTWGLWRPIILLPAESGQWPEERLRLVLRHELAHVKRWDCLTQEIAYAACLLYWFNPLAWLSARWMRVEREKACDDFVLNAGTRPSEYASQLVEIARQFSLAANSPGVVAMARPKGLEKRVIAILDARRNRSQTGKWAVAFILSSILGLELLVGGCTTENHSPKRWSLEHSPVGDQLRHFVAEKKAQESVLVKEDEKMAWSNARFQSTDCGPFFAAAAKGDWLTVSNLFSEMQTRLQNATNTVVFQGKTNRIVLRGRWWQPVLETYGAIEAFANGNEKYSIAYGDAIIKSIPPSSIFFGGTDPGRFIVTALEKSQVKADPFFTLTQNALADGTYLEYLRSMYNGKIYTPTAKDTEKCFQDYLADAQRRLKENKLKPGEHVKEVSNGPGNPPRIQVSGRTAVMEINGLLAKIIFDKSPDHEFYIEQSFPLDWMYPYLEPHGLIFKINREPLEELPDQVVQRDHEFWRRLVNGMIGDWLKDETTVKEVTDFAEKIYLHKNLSGFNGDPQFVQNEYACKMFSKERTSIADLYVWRSEHAQTPEEKERMIREADFAYRQAFALCPYSPEVTKDYVKFLKNRGRESDAALISAIAGQFPSASNSESSNASKAKAAKSMSSVFQMRLVEASPADDAEQMTIATQNRDSGKTYFEKLYVQKKVLLDQNAVESAKVNQTRFGPQIQIQFTDAGRRQFAEVTRECLHKRIAIIVDGRVLSAPIIQSEISGGVGQISGSFSDQEAQALATKINDAIAN